MAEPFQIVRRKPAASATYGRKAMAARRIGISHTPALVTAGPGKQTQSLKVPSHSSPLQLEADKSDIDSDDTSRSSSSNTTNEFSSAFTRKSKSHSTRKKGQNDDDNKAAAKYNVALDGGSWTHRTAQSAMSKLDLLYQSAKTAETARPGGPLQKTLDSANDCWDFADEGLARSEQKQNDTATLSTESADLPKRIVLDNTDIIVTGKLASVSTKKLKSKTFSNRGATRAFPKPTKVLSHKQQPVASVPAAATLKARSKPRAQSRDLRTKRARNDTSFRSGVENSSDSLDISGDPAQSDVALLTNLDAWDMDSLIKGDPPNNNGYAKSAKRKASAQRRSRSTSNRKNVSDRRSSSPPSALSRQLERSRISNSSSNWRNSAAESNLNNDNGSVLKHMCSQQAQTPRAQINNKHILRSTQGPSSATSRRLQARAVRQNVVYTYGRNRESEDDTDIEHILGFSNVLGTCTSQRLLTHDSRLNNGDSGINSDTIIIDNYDDNSDCDISLPRAISAHKRQLLDLADFSLATGSVSDEARSSTTEMFKKQIGDILQAFSLNPPDCSLEIGCRLLLDNLDQADFCEELLNSKYWLQTLLQTLYRNLNVPIMQSLMIVMIACAFKIPTVMQSLVFDRQILETVAETLKLTLDMDILSLRRKRDFDNPDQFECIARICKLARKQELVGPSLPVSCYNIALSALHSFTRTDDAAFLAMAPLLRNEVRESGCLGLIVNRVFSQSFPNFIFSAQKQHNRQQKAGSSLLPSSILSLSSSSSISYLPFDDICATNPLSFKARLLRFPRSSGISSSCLHKSNNDSDSEGENNANDDIWLKFDIQESHKDDIFGHAAAASFKRRNKGKSKDVSQSSSRDKTTTDIPSIAKDTGDLKRVLKNEPLGMLPTFASIAAELEFLRFCTSASSDSQTEMLQIDSSVPMLLSLLTMCQEESTGLHGDCLIRALETAVLTLQLLVNLSNSSTVFSSKFVAERGLNVVSKSIALMAQRIKPDSFTPRNSMASDFSPRRKALLDDANDLRYDILLITSALLTNLVESDSSTALYFNHVMQSPRCLLNKQCFPECTCSDRVSLNALLGQAFSACHAAGESSPDAVIAAGYISVLLGFLMHGKTPSREAILKSIPGRDASVVIAHIEKFIEISDTVNQRFGGMIGGLAKAAQNPQDSLHYIAYQGISDIEDIEDNDNDNDKDCAFGLNSKKLALSTSIMSAQTNCKKISKKPSQMASSLRSIIASLAEL
ncbi:hypothetical protein LPJ64_001211 [Coemansia asiatica]|uniref:Wings apart-like protein C-terminal domain-containing protein n=1 Tax=Coemansia asiatica TaxID=1052880 RepID=A0A9W7XR39_9FUNG|nr:hypothetical protein LPJ64_001211 [Coemansia asiatica]